LVARTQYELVGRPHPTPEPREKPAVVGDVWTRLGRPGAEALGAPRSSLSLPPNGFPEKEWSCDADGNVMQSFIHALNSVTVNGVPLEASRCRVIDAFGGDYDTLNGSLRFDLDGYYALFQMKDDLVDSMFVGRCT